MHKELFLKRNVVATLVPAGDEVTLEKGTLVTVSQALGGTATVRTPTGLFRIGTRDLDALDESYISEQNDAENEHEAEFSENILWETLKTCFDPEIPINIVDLGLIYDLAWEPASENAKYKVSAKMTLTAQGCGMGPTIAQDAKEKLEALPFVDSAQVDIVWDPVWNPHMISAEGRKTLGIN